MSPVMYDVEMHEDDDFQKTLDMADESKPKKVRVNFALTLRINFRQKHFVIYLYHFFIPYMKISLTLLKPIKILIDIHFITCSFLNLIKIMFELM